MIESFGDELAEKIFSGVSDKRVYRFPSEVRKIAKRKLDMIQFAHNLRDLSVPPANRLEKLRGRLEDFYSIRINDQWRIIFKWDGDGAQEVRIVDYH